MLNPSFTKQFDRDLKGVLKSGKDKEKIKLIIFRLIKKKD